MCGMTLQIRTPSYVEGGLGWQVWPAARILSEFMIKSPQAAGLIDNTVLELSAGLGAPGIVAGKLGAEKVYLTDNHPKMIELARLNACENGLPYDIVRGIHCDWKDFTEAESLTTNGADVYNSTGLDAEVPKARISNGEIHVPQPDGQVEIFPQPDVVLGAAIVYDEDHGQHLPTALRKATEISKGLVHMANHSGHSGHMVFLRRMLEEGFEEISFEVHEVPPALDGTLYSPVRLSTYRLRAGISH